MIENYYQYDLDFDRTFEFVKDNLDSTNTLCEQLLKLVNFKEGNFFTYLLPQADENKIHRFKYSILSCVINRNGVSNYVFKYIKKNPQVLCLFDDALRKSTDKHLDTFNKCGLLYKNEIYYFIDRQNLDEDLILQCFQSSSAIWHSLCILTKMELNRKEPNILTLEMINNICKNAKVILIGAYDDEGYIFWEKNT